MEVFLRNIPGNLSEDELSLQLRPFLKRLSIIDYLCEKPRRKRYGSVTFLNRCDGQKFLDVHGPLAFRSTNTYPHMQSTAIIQLLGCNLQCQVSRNNPNPVVLKTILYATEQRKTSGEKIKEKEQAISFELEAFSCGSCTYVAKRLIYTPEVEWQDHGTIRLTAHSLVVKLLSHKTIRIPLATIIELIWDAGGFLTLTLSTVPFLFSESPKDLVLLMLRLNFSAGNGQAVPKRTRLCSLSPEHEKIVGQCLVYRFKVLSSDLYEKIIKLKSYEIPVTRYDLDECRPAFRKNYAYQLQLLRNKLAAWTSDKSVSFGILFQLQALAYNAYLHPSIVVGLADEIHRAFSTKTTANQISIRSLRRLSQMIDWPSPYGDYRDWEVSSLFQAVREAEQEIQSSNSRKIMHFDVKQDLVEIHRVMVTPTHITLHGPEMIPKNRILRKFPNHHDYFIRGQFCDENGQDLYYSSQVNLDRIYERFKETLRRGFQIAGRTYTFLGFSHSSLRSHSAWFSAPFFNDNGEFQTYFSIIKALGSFSHITSPARCAARIGQAFSETPYALALKDTQIEYLTVSDATTTDGSRVFSDGVGGISPDVMKAIWSILPWDKGRPTCFQVRFGGAKGMLALDSQLTGTVIHLRPSMVKFNANDMQTLEICDMASKPIRFVLNRQIIKILEDMGVSEDWFLELQNLEVARLRHVTANTLNAARFMKTQHVASTIRFHKFLRCCDTLQLDYRNDPFLRSVVEAIVLRELRLVKHKARIPVDQAITLFGVTDETNFLKEGQVYVTFDDQKGIQAPPSGMQVLVTRSPALHNGDIQLVTNVGPPHDHPLAQHRNCIVFSQNGERDLPSQLSGGDLDGDLYNIIWDERAKPVQTFKPADYPRVEPLDIGRLVQMDDMTNFFVDFMKTDHLGIIATKHMILADQKDLGTCDEDCVKLAHLHSVAVDFSKSGIPVNMQTLPRMNSHRPDFLAPGLVSQIYKKSDIELVNNDLPELTPEDNEYSGPSRKYYGSERILGKLYRAIDDHQIWVENIRYRPDLEGVSFWKEFTSRLIDWYNELNSIKWAHRRDEALSIRSAYDDAVFSARTDFSEHPINTLSELEVFVGCILNSSGVQNLKQRERSIQLTDEIERIISWILKLIRRQRAEDHPTADRVANFDVLELCLACFYVADDRRDLNDGRRKRRLDGEVKSFKVVAASALMSEIDYLDRKMVWPKSTQPRRPISSQPWGK